MDKTFHLSKRSRTLSIAFAIGFPLVWAAYTTFALLAPDVANRIGAVLLFSAVWGTMSCLAILGAIMNQHFELRIADGCVFHRQLIRRRRINLADVANVIWRWAHRGIVLCTPLEKVKISFSYLETADTLWLIRFFRKTIPLERQCDWNMFAFKVANRLRDRDELENRPLSHDEVLITRQRWNGLFALFIPVLAVAGVYVYQQTGKLGPLFAPLGLIPFWILIRLMVPANGMRSKRLSAQPDAWYLYFLFASLALPIIEIILSKTVWPQINNSIAMWVTAFVWFVALIVATFLLERQVRRRECNESALAADKWDMGEAAAHDD